MKRILSLILVLLSILSLCSCKKTFSDLASEIEKFLPETQDVVEVRYEEFAIEEPQMSGCYKSLTKKQKDFYSRIYAISEEMTVGYVNMGEYYEDASNDVTVAYTAFLNDNAEIFWMPNTYVLATSGSGKNKKLAIAFEDSDDKERSSYPMSRSQRDKRRKELDEKVNEVLKKLKKIDGEYQKEKYINDYICDKVIYDEKADLSSTAYGALVNGRALCEGYSRAFKLLCNKIGIECELIIGRADNTGHMWNRVNIDRKHAYVDVTWNDQEEHKSYAYFNITDEQIEKTHTFAPYLSENDDAVDKKGFFNFVKKECTYSGNTYYEQEGFLIWYDYVESATEKIEDAEDEGWEQAEFMFASQSARSLFEKNPEKFLREIQKGLSGISISAYSYENDILTIYFE